MAKSIIGIGDSQPIDCPVCKSKQGYRVVDVIQKSCETLFHPDGSYSTVVYSEYEKLIYQGRSAYCSVCMCRLGFNVNGR